MTSVFEAVALYNPYPAEQLGEDAWNQMVLKAVFLGNGLHAIQGLERRANQRLARMLVDYARERWAARRSVAPELWRLVAPFSDETIIGDLGRALGDPDRAQQKAAALALMQSPAPRAAEFLARRPDLEVMIKDGRLNWESFGDDYLSADA